MSLCRDLYSNCVDKFYVHVLYHAETQKHPNSMYVATQ